jgi:hypothetical protein
MYLGVTKEKRGFPLGEDYLFPLVTLECMDLLKAKWGAGGVVENLGPFWLCSHYWQLSRRSNLAGGWCITKGNKKERKDVTAPRSAGEGSFLDICGKADPETDTSGRV